MLSQELLEELREIVREDLGKELSDKELFEFGENLLSYFELLAKIYARENLKDLRKVEEEIKFDSLAKGL
ncbi:hypothetical protein D6D85_04635 [Candidatus Methanodesulfokora washburnensis]|jgi:hypothetical protein|uniref:Uncharacterized protein n=1 Tax=Candidatus Methanodesulfokora washburnensis TaxID=2478471 RepID=A0A429GQF8_9CREN|nr:hypothetical protein D6D85_04635 [Candidatus Methanodesulfokores washburnensis]